jgi:hypothetical protein
MGLRWAAEWQAELRRSKNGCVVYGYAGCCWYWPPAERQLLLRFGI